MTIIPAKGTKRFGGSRSGVIGTTLGLVVGILSQIPFGIIIGSIVGELLHQNEKQRATKATFGCLIGFIPQPF